MTLTVCTQDVDGITVLALGGVADDELMIEVVTGIEAVTGGQRCIVLDVDDLWLVDVAAVRSFLVRLVDGSAADHVVFACARLSGRRILRRWAGEHMPIFPTLAEAAAACRELSQPTYAAVG